VLSLYRAALALRRERRAGGSEALTWLDAEGEVLAFSRPGLGLTCVVNVGDEPVDRPVGSGAGAVLLASGPLEEGGRIPGATAVWYDGG
jgi:alpha-glucosidase